MTTITGNNLDSPVPNFCLAVEQFRRAYGRGIRSAKEFREFLFPYTEASGEDKVFHRLPNEVRGPILAAWGIRGARSALKDSDEKVRTTVHDALLAGDLDDAQFEEGLVAGVVIRWLDLAEWWRFVRGGKLDRPSRRMMLERAYEFGLFDAKWFFENLQTRGGKLHGTDVVADALSKQELTDWLRRIHETGDGSAKGILEAIGWEKITEKTALDALDGILDSTAKKVGLVAPDPVPESRPAVVDDLGANSAPNAGKDPADPKGEAAAGAKDAAAAGTATGGSTPPESTGGAPLVEAREGDADIDGFFGEEDAIIVGDGKPSAAPPPGEEVVPSGGAATGDEEPTGDVSAAARTAVERVRTATGEAEVDWGAHAPDPARSAVEAEAERGDNSPPTARAVPTPLPPFPRPGRRFGR